MAIQLVQSTDTIRHFYTVASASHCPPPSDGHWRMLLRPGVNNAQMLHLLSSLQGPPSHRLCIA